MGLGLDLRLGSGIRVRVRVRRRVRVRVTWIGDSLPAGVDSIPYGKVTGVMDT
jgi:hypothetical protein